MIIAEADLKDLPATADIRNKAFSHFAPQSYSAQEVQTLLNDLDEPHLRGMIEDKKMFVMKDGEQVIGSAGWDAENVRHVYVDPARTREGIASRLLAHAEQDYQHRTGKQEISAGIALYARKFYEANGYSFISEDTVLDSPS